MIQHEMNVQGFESPPVAYTLRSSSSMASLSEGGSSEAEGVESPYSAAHLLGSRRERSTINQAIQFKEVSNG